MCNGCSDDVIWHVDGERPVHREHCMCRCHDRTEGGHMVSGAARDDVLAATTACDRCRWAHAVAYSTADWRNDERYMRPPLTPVGAGR